MTASITFFPVGNGDMTLINLDNDQTILIDMHVRAAADDEDDDTPDVMGELRQRLKRDADGRLYVDAFLLSHPDRDHICGLETHFHLGPPEDWDDDDDKILIREMWSSPLVFRRASKDETEVDDAKAWWAEARRRVKLFREIEFATGEGDRILIMGEDRDGKTDDITDIVVPAGTAFNAANRISGGAFEARLLGPLPPSDDEKEEELLSKNGSSVILRFSLAGGGYADKCGFLTGGDAGVAIWERIWNEYGDANPDWLAYDVLLAPHHCSWRSLSYDSYSDYGEDAEVCEEARSALAQTRKGAIVVASSKHVDASDCDPPSDRAKREYVDILGADDRFICVANVWDEEDRPLEYEINSSGTIKKVRAAAALAAASLGIGATAAQARPHGNR